MLERYRRGRFWVSQSDRCTVCNQLCIYSRDGSRPYFRRCTHASHMAMMGSLIMARFFSLAFCIVASIALHTYYYNVPSIKNETFCTHTHMGKKAGSTEDCIVYCLFCLMFFLVTWYVYTRIIRVMVHRVRSCGPTDSSSAPIPIPKIVASRLAESDTRFHYAIPSGAGPSKK